MRDAETKAQFSLGSLHPFSQRVVQKNIREEPTSGVPARGAPGPTSAGSTALLLAGSFGASYVNRCNTSRLRF